MFYEPLKRDHGLPHDPVKAVIAPRPIGWISAMNREGAVNLSPYSYFNMVADRPPMVVFGSDGVKDAVAYAIEGGEFVCSIVSYDQREQMNQTSAPYPRGVSEFGPAGLEMEPSRLVRPPRVKGAPAALECRLVRALPLETASGKPHGHVLVIGEVVGIHIEDCFIRDGRVDTAAMRIISRGGYHDYFLADTHFEMVRPTGI